MKVKVVEHFPFGCIDGDYHYVTIEKEDGEIIKRYEDHYHDKGSDKASGFLDGLSYIVPNLKVKYVMIDDADGYEQPYTVESSPKWKRHRKKS